MKKQLLITAAILLGSSIVSAQTQSVRGVITDASTGEPIIGANVIVKGHSGVGTVTDLDGKFTLSAPKGATYLTISYIGYKTMDVKVGTNLKVKLEADTKMLNETIVVAYGTATKNSFTGSASKVSVESLQKKAASNLSTALEGEIPGVQVFNTNGQPGTSAKIQIRGIGSVNSDTSPLYVVDGVPYGGTINGIDPSDIENMSVLKDASATALYGARAANGVVLITTRKGKSGKPVIEASGSVGLNMRLIPLYDVIKSPEQYLEVAYQSLYNLHNTFKKKADGSNVAVGGLLFANKAGSIPTRYNLWNAASAELIDPKTGKFNPNIARKYTPENWEDAIFRTGKRYEGNVKVSGGSENTTYFLSGGYQKTEGYYIGSDFSRANLRSNVSSNITKNLKAGLNLSYSYTQTNSPGQSSSASNGFEFLSAVPSIYPVYEYALNEQTKRYEPKADSKIPGGISYDFGQADGSSRPYSGGINPAGTTKLDRLLRQDNNLSAVLNLEYRFLNDFKATITYGKQYLGRVSNQLQNPYYGDAKGVGRITRTNQTYTDETFTQLLSWGHQYGKHNVDAFVAHESTENNNSVSSANRSQLIQPDVLELSNAIINDSSDSYTLGYAMESYFGRARYDYDGKYFLNASIRRDGSSRFSKDNRWGTFGSVGAAWLISKEKFLQDAKWLNTLKLKASYGVLGNQEIDLQYDSDIPSYYVYYDLYSVSNLNDKPSFSFYAKGNPDLTWEKSATFNVGFEAELFNRKLSINAEYFHKRTTDMLFRQQTAPSVGYAYYPSNDAAIVNRGLEFDLSYKALDLSKVKLNLRANAGLYRNEITQMPLEPSTGKPKIYEEQGTFAYKKGHSVQDYYMPIYAGITSTGLPQWEYYYTEDASGKKTAIQDLENWLQVPSNDPSSLKQGTTSNYNNATKQFVGKSAIPDLVGGFGFDLTVHGVTLSSAFSFGLGGYGYDGAYATLMDPSSAIGSSNWHKDILDSWSPTNTNGSLPILGSNASELSQATSRSTRFLTSRSYLNLSNVRISYDLPKSLVKHVGLERASVYVSGDNLFLISARKGFVSMSSSSGSSSSNRYLPMSTITAGVQIKL